ncbi:MAG: hypothetical protein PF904_10890 [Kiritimatiellae bacterium]|jgi:hypothetical protein|nr:hypothetical protein [Kiritimatiellia bacterium]
MWREPTTDDFRDALLEAEISAFSRASIAQGKDAVGKAIDNAVGRFRVALRSGSRVTMGADRTLPHDLIPQAMHMAAFYFIGGRVGSKLSESRTILYKDAKELATAIANKTLKYTDPDDTEETQTDSVPRPHTTPKTKTLSRAQQNGI